MRTLQLTDEETEFLASLIGQLNFKIDAPVEYGLAVAIASKIRQADNEAEGAD